MTARILDGKTTSAQIRSEVAERVQALSDKGIIPGLAAVLVGDDPASRIYVGQKHKASADVGIRSEQVDLPAYVTEHELLATIRRLNRDPEIHGIIVQLPLPGHLPELDIQRAILPEKDVDGLHPWNIGMMVRRGPCFLPATPYGIVELLLRCEVPLEGAEATIVGYGELVGAPLSVMLTQNSVRGNATVTSTHIRTRDLRAHTLRADILVAAAGVPQLIGADMVKPGATVVDVGVHRTDHGLVGDVRFDEVAEVAGAISPVPGGVGPMTVAMLLVNTVQAAEAQAYGRP
ncbi:MAG: bifunctional 5,10-methylenetetrahydrofolate dehydrogenase/5,10-methenyltetrahydrofolate cyclohydrolase [Actinobacteria bacterium]|nr:MAG: bifunctional 5,10-methylenetetrahydrofolate dehydrogenase/5,10-methenyltetrahydrofolate cyclohydrolase [Actinomycetota bacterium]TMK92210.1 MAG: bifunctional 5,10-methylenetetrahydrofolate dehydrogenase/5,10-methenyltetrahydrofolate cyclohydrolase [Actinomycetota bacterium]TMM26354.1 MAG: bifunctional 5,10-methylenetetrahydrofolate dehydrogenase/5,10-methenyltetrahydrofolate cyclohydrolase [Actinomycetota bacterium]